MLNYEINEFFVTKRRKPYHYEADFTRLGLNPRNTDIVVVKIGYLVPELYNMRADWIMALTPGGVDQELTRLNHRMLSLILDLIEPVSGIVKSKSKKVSETDEWKKYIRELSAGNKNKPEILILDEPFANLDPSSHSWLKSRLKKLPS